MVDTPKPAEEKPEPKERGPQGQYRKVQYDPAVLLETWRSLGKHPSAGKLHRALNAQGLKCSSSWVDRKVKEHNLVALGGMAALENDVALLNVKSVRRFLETIGKDMNPHDLLSGLQTRTLVAISQHLDGPETNTEWLSGMMKFYSSLTGELTSTYQKRLAAGEDIDLPEKKVEKDEKVTPFTRRKA